MQAVDSQTITNLHFSLSTHAGNRTNTADPIANLATNTSIKRQKGVAALMNNRNDHNLFFFMILHL